MRGFLNTIKIDMNFLWSLHFLCNRPELLPIIRREYLYFGGKACLSPFFFFFVHKRLCALSRTLFMLRETAPEDCSVSEQRRADWKSAWTK